MYDPFSQPHLQHSQQGNVSNEPALKGGELRITKLLMFETGTYNQQWRRPYQTTLDGSTFNMMEERLAGTNRFVSSHLAGVAGQFVRPMATPETAVQIAGGWNERRMRFIMEVEYRYAVGCTIVENILGYTSHRGVINNAVDHDMDFFINSIVHVRRTQENTPLGMATQASVIESSHVLADQRYMNVAQGVKDQRLRPSDVYMAMTRNHLDPTQGQVFDARTVMTSAPEKSKRSNVVPATYMANILDKYQAAAITVDRSVQDVQQEVLHIARGYVAEDPTGKDPFLKALSSSRGQPLSHTFTYRDLMRLQPNVETVTMAMIQAQTQRQNALPTHYAGDTSEWGGADGLTLAATILSQSVPGLLMDLAITFVAFKASNMNFGIGQGHSPVFIQIGNAEGFSTADLGQQIEHFKIRLEHEILNDISYNNGISYSIDMVVDLLGETRVSISMDGGPMMPFVTPSFSDALIAPVITSDQNRVVKISQDFEALFGALSVNQEPSAPVTPAHAKYSNNF
jgi:hypothetical protein